MAGKTWELLRIMKKFTTNITKYNDICEVIRKYLKEKFAVNPV